MRYLLVGLLLMVPVATAQQPTPSNPAEDCADVRLEEWTTGTWLDGQVVVRIDNQGPPGDLRVCVFDAQSKKRVDERYPLAAGQVSEYRFPVPAGRYFVEAELTFGSTRLTSTHGLDLF